MNVDPSPSQSAGAAGAAGAGIQGPMLGYLIAALIAAVATFLVLHTSYPFFVLTGELADLPVPAPAEDLARQDAAIREVTLYNAFVVLMTFGGALAVGAALVESVSRRSFLRGLVALVLGAALGVGAGAAGAWTADTLLWQFAAGGSTLLECAAATAAVFAPLGLAFGLTVGIASASLRTMLRAGAFGFVGGGLTAVFYAFIAGLVFSDAPTDVVIPISLATRLMWLLLPAIAISLVVAASESSGAATAQR